MSDTNQKTSVFSNALIWFGAGVSIAEIITGTYFAPLGFGKGLLAVIIGHIIGCTMLFLAGLIGIGGSGIGGFLISLAGACILIAIVRAIMGKKF